MTINIPVLHLKYIWFSGSLTRVFGPFNKLGYFFVEIWKRVWLAAHWHHLWQQTGMEYSSWGDQVCPLNCYISFSYLFIKERKFETTRRWVTIKDKKIIKVLHKKDTGHRISVSSRGHQMPIFTLYTSPFIPTITHSFLIPYPCLVALPHSLSLIKNNVLNNVQCLQDPNLNSTTI